MTHIRSTLVAGLFVFGAAAVASAQQATPAPASQAQAQGALGRQHGMGGGGGGRHGNRLLAGIELSSAEKASVKTVHEKYAPQMKALRTQPKSDARRAEAKQLMTAERTDLRAALSAANQAKFDANVARMDERMAQRKARKGTR